MTRQISESGFVTFLSDAIKEDDWVKGVDFYNSGITGERGLIVRMQDGAKFFVRIMKVESDR